MKIFEKFFHDNFLKYTTLHSFLCVGSQIVFGKCILIRYWMQNLYTHYVRHTIM